MPTQCSQEELDFGSCRRAQTCGCFRWRRHHVEWRCAAARCRRPRDPVDRSAGQMLPRSAAAPDGITHTIAELLRQRIFALALGYEDLIDHDQLRHDPVLAAVLDKRRLRAAGREVDAEPAGACRQDRPGPAPQVRSRRRGDRAAVSSTLFMDAHCEPPIRIEIDLDATDDPLYGQQEGRHFHGYYDCYCYLPLYIFCGRHLLAAKLRSSSADAAEGSVEEVARIVAQIRARWPTTSIVLRADSGFCRDDLMSWCEANNVRLRARPRRQPAARRQDRARAEEGTTQGQANGSGRRASSRTFATARARAGAASAG